MLKEAGQRKWTTQKQSMSFVIGKRLKLLTHQCNMPAGRFWFGLLCNPCCKEASGQFAPSLCPAQEHNATMSTLMGQSLMAVYSCKAANNFICRSRKMRNTSRVSQRWGQLLRTWSKQTMLLTSTKTTLLVRSALMATPACRLCTITA